MGEPSKITAPTVNPYEMSHYKRLSALWENPNAIQGLRALNKIRIPWIIDRLVETNVISKDAAKSKKPLQGLTILDVGCGGGFATECLAELGCTVVGIDPCPEQIDVAKRRLLQNPLLTKNITYINGCMEEHCEDNLEKYDIILASEVLDHVDEQQLFLELCVTCLKPGGSIFVTTFNKTWLSWLIVIIIFEYVTGTIPFGTHSYDKFISPEDVEKILQKCNCQTKSVSGMFYNNIFGKWHWFSYTWISYALHAVKNKK